MLNKLKLLLLIPLIAATSFGVEIFQWEQTTLTSSRNLIKVGRIRGLDLCPLAARATVSALDTIATEDHFAIGLSCTSGALSSQMHDPNAMKSAPEDGNIALSYELIDENGAKADSGFVIVNSKAQNMALQPIFLMRLGLTSGTPAQDLTSGSNNQPIYHLDNADFDTGDPHVKLSIRGNLSQCPASTFAVGVAVHGCQVNDNVFTPDFRCIDNQNGDTFRLTGQGSVDMKFPFLIKPTGTEIICQGSGGPSL